MRLIVTTFLFLGWGFYELSGGSEFVAEKRVTAEPLEQTEVVAETIEPTPSSATVIETRAVATDANPIESVTTKLDVSPASLVVVEEAPEPETAPDETIVEAVPVPNADALDIRLVDKARVNVRSGPGTNYDVAAKLVAGDETQVIEDLGNGWVQIIMPDGSSGWMADFLLTPKAN